MEDKQKSLICRNSEKESLDEEVKKYRELLRNKDHKKAKISRGVILDSIKYLENLNLIIYELVNDEGELKKEMKINREIRTLRVKIEIESEEIDVKSSSSAVGSGQRARVKLPVLNIPTYDGTYDKWAWMVSDLRIRYTQK